MTHRNRNVLAGIGAALAALAGAVLVAFAGIALADPVGPVQPGVVAPAAPPPAPADPGTDQSAELHSAAPQDTEAPAPRRRSPRREAPDTTTPSAPRELHIGDLSAPVPGIVPDAVVDGVNRTNQDLQNVIKPTAAPRPRR